MKHFKQFLLAMLVALMSSVTANAQYVMDFKWEETGTVDGYSPAITVVVGESHKLQYSYSSNSMGNMFAQENRGNWNFYDFSPMQHIVDESEAVFRLDEDGNVIGVKEGLGGLKANGKIINASGTGILLIKVVSCRSEVEDNNTIATANKYISPVEFMLNSKSDIDCFEIQLPNNGNSTENFHITLESQLGSDLRGHQITVYNTAGETYGVGNANGTSFTQTRWGWAGSKMYVAISWDPDYSYYWQYNHKVKLTIDLEEPYTGPEFVDLGLSIKWATCNLGADKPEAYGDKYAWGAIDEATDWKGVPYNDLLANGIIDSKGNLTPQYDIATQKLGQEWRMPTYEEVTQLMYNCSWTWSTQNGTYGYEVKGKNGNKIFLPGDLNSDSYYWTSSITAGNDSWAKSYFFRSNNYAPNSGTNRNRKCFIRPVTSKEISNGIYSITKDGNGSVNVYNINGQIIRTAVKAEMSFDGLPNGIYVVNGKKIYKK